MTSIAAGTIWAVFGHRLAIEDGADRVLVDLGPGFCKSPGAGTTPGAEMPVLAVGDTITVEGERTPCEIRVSRLTLADGRAFPITHPGKPGSGAKQDGAGDPAKALRIVREAGYRVEGEPERKPKHVEIRGIRDGQAFCLHVHADGTIRKAEPLAA